MKKLSLMLALILTLTTGALCSCDSKKEKESDDDEGTVLNAEEKAAMEAFEAYYVDGDIEAYTKVALDCNIDILKEYIDSDDVDNMKEEARENQKEAKNEMRDQWEYYTDDSEIEKFKVRGEVVSCNTYKPESNYFDRILRASPYANTSIEDYIEKVAIVEILMSVSYNEADDKITSSRVKTYYCYNIDGDWYVLGQYLTIY